MFSSGPSRNGGSHGYGGAANDWFWGFVREERQWAIARKGCERQFAPGQRRLTRKSLPIARRLKSAYYPRQRLSPPGPSRGRRRDNRAGTRNVDEPGRLDVSRANRPGLEKFLPLLRADELHCLTAWGEVQSAKTVAG